MDVPMYDLKREYLADREAYLSLFDEVCRSAQFADGVYAARFESAFGAYLGGMHAAAVNSGTDALILALKALGVGPGDEVIVPSATFNATPGAVALTGAVPVFADCEEDTWQISPASARGLITDKTKAVIGVHLYGGMFDVRAFRRLTREAGLFLIEDCAQALGASLHGAPAGSFGDAACFSFYPTKNLGSFGEGGAVVSADNALIDRVQLLKKHARTPEGDHLAVSGNMRMHGLQGAILTKKLERLPDFLARKARIAACYRKAAAQSPALTVQATEPGSVHAYHLFAVLPDDRDRFTEYLTARGIAFSVQYPVPCHRQTAFAAFGGARSLPVTERLFSRVVTVPSYPYLTEEEILAVAAALREYR